MLYFFCLHVWGIFVAYNGPVVVEWIYKKVFFILVLLRLKGIFYVAWQLSTIIIVFSKTMQWQSFLSEGVIFSQPFFPQMWPVPQIWPQIISTCQRYKTSTKGILPKLKCVLHCTCILIKDFPPLTDEIPKLILGV